MQSVSQPPMPPTPPTPPTEAHIDAWIASLQAQRHAIEAAQSQWHAFTAWMSATQIEALRPRAQTFLNGPLAGAVVAVKDIFDSEHLPTAYGSPIYQGHRPAGSSAVVQSIERAGGVVLGKTVTTEFAFLEPPPTRNPRAPHLTPGGSSSGSVAAIAAGLVRFAVGTQTGGSVIRPASYCGVVGYKPTFGLLNTAGLKPFSSSLDTAGLFAGSAADGALLARALIPFSSAPVGSGSGKDTKAKSPRLGMILHYPWGDPSEEYQQALKRVAAQARASGVEIVDVELPALIAEVYEAHAVVQGYEAWRALAFEYDNKPAQLSTLLRSYLDEQAGITASQYQQALNTFERGRAWADEFFADMDGLLGAAAPGPAPDPGSTGSSSFNRVWTALGVPAITVPIPRLGPLPQDTLPLGLQLIGGRYRDESLLHHAALLESIMTNPGDTNMLKPSAVILASALAAGCVSMPAVPEAARAELAPQGKLRAGMNLGNTLFTGKDAASGELRGVSVDLMRELASRLGVPVEFVVHATPGQVADDSTKGTWDVAILAIEQARAKTITFSPPMTEIEASYMVYKDSALRSAGQVDAPGIRIAVPDKAGYELYLTRTIRNATLVRSSTTPGAIDLFKERRADTLAGLKPNLLDLMAGKSDVRLLDGNFMVVNHGLGTPSGRPAAAAYLKAFVEDINASGFVARSIARHGVQGLAAVK